jgi:hypothetical protein
MINLFFVIYNIKKGFHIEHTFFLNTFIKMNFLSNDEQIPNTDEFKEVLRDYRKIFFAMKKILDPTYTYPYTGENNKKLKFDAPNQTLDIGDNTVLDKIVQNNTEIVDGRQAVNPKDSSSEGPPYYYYVSLSKKAIFPKLRRVDINPSISNFFMAHELSHIVYRKLFEKIKTYIDQSGLTQRFNERYNLSSLFRTDNELNFRPKTQSKEILCDIFGIIILWITSLIDEANNFPTISFLIKLFENLTIDSIERSTIPEIEFLRNEFGEGSDSHPSCAKRLLTIKYIINGLSIFPREMNEENIFNFFCVGLDALNKFHKLNSGNPNYHQLVRYDRYVEYQPIPITPNWNDFKIPESPATIRGGSRKTKSIIKRQTKKKNPRRHKKTKSKN